jgi:hypothetical protein
MAGEIDVAKVRAFLRNKMAGDGYLPRLPD